MVLCNKNITIIIDFSNLCSVIAVTITEGTKRGPIKISLTLHEVEDDEQFHSNKHERLSQNI